MTRWGACLALAGVGALAAVALSPVASAASATAAGSCNRATARTLIDQHDLNGFGLADPVAQLLCGPFTGPGSDAMAVTIAASTCWAQRNLTVFSFRNGAWQLVFTTNGAFVQPPIVAVGSGIRETRPVFRSGDPRCVPSGGTRSHVWRWNGSRFVAGPWTQVTPATGGTGGTTPSGPAASFSSPSRNLVCEADSASVVCISFTPPHRAVLGSDGTLALCQTGIRCTSDPGEEPHPALAYGRARTVGPFRCTSQKVGITCRLIRTGKGFLINKAGATRVG